MKKNSILDNLLEKAFCDGYYYAQLEFGRTGLTPEQAKEFFTPTGNRENKKHGILTAIERNRRMKMDSNGIGINTRINAKAQMPEFGNNINRKLTKQEKEKIKDLFRGGKDVERDVKSKNPLKRMFPGYIFPLTEAETLSNRSMPYNVSKSGIHEGNTNEELKKMIAEYRNNKQERKKGIGKLFA